MLQRSSRMRKKRVKALTDPKPEFVSLVFAGANKTPFRALRAEGHSEEDMNQTAFKADTHAIARIEFDSAHFADEAAVSAWLADGGYEGHTVEKTDAGFMVAGDVPEGAEITEIEIEGMKLHVIAAKGDEDLHPGAEEAAEAGLEEVRQRCSACYNAVEATYGVGRTMKEVNANSFTDMPPGMLDLTMNLYDAIRNNLREGDVTAAKACITEFSSLFDKLLDIFPGKDVPTLTAFVDAIAPEVEMTKQTEEQPATEVVAEETAAKADEVVVEATEVVAEAPAEEIAAEKAEVVEGEAPAATEVQAGAVEEIAKSDDPLAALTALVGNLAQSVQTLSETVAQKSEEIAERVAAIEDVRQTRKGADVDETGTASAVTAEDESTTRVAELRTRSVLGMRRSVSN
jgi:hypothetical protein